MYETKPEVPIVCLDTKNDDFCWALLTTCMYVMAVLDVDHDPAVHGKIKYM